MKNILSYQLGSSFSGKEIKDWIRENLNPNSSHYSIAKSLSHFLTLKDNKRYILAKENYSSCESYNHYIFLVE